MDKLGFIGIGTMGEPMCKNIIEKSGKETIVYDVSPAQIEKMKEHGAQAASSIAEVGEAADTIFIMVPKSEHVRSVIDELTPSLDETKIVVDMSTIDVTMTTTVAEEVKRTGADFIDAPVVKSQPAAIAGELGIYVGGSQQTYEKVKPILACMGKDIIHMGENGKGISMKIAHNLLVAQIQNGVNEMLVLTEKAGLDMDDVIEAISYGGGQNFYLDSKKGTIKAEDYSAKFSFENMNKDIGLALQMAERLNLDLPGARLVEGVYSKGMSNDIGKEDFSATIKVVKEFA